MKKSMLPILTALLLICFLLQPIAVQASAGDTSSDCSLTLVYSKEGYVFSDCAIEIYRVAQRHNNGNFSLVTPFDRHSVRVNGITSQKEWQDTANTLEACVIADGIVPVQTDKTDENGSVSFQNLQTGLYLVRGVTAENSVGSCSFQNALILLPSPQNNGSLSYDLEARPKGSFTPTPEEPTEPDFPEEPKMEHYQVVKLWKDSGYSSRRPDSVTVSICKNGTLWETVKLDAGNNWTYSWDAPVNNDSWTVLERAVEDDYTVSITTDGHTFSITNSRRMPAGTPPKTGDSFPLSLLSVVSCLSGILLLAVGIWHQRKYG